MKIAVAVLFLSLCACSLSPQWFFSDEQDVDTVLSQDASTTTTSSKQLQEQSHSSPAPHEANSTMSKSMDDESDVWSIEVQAGQSATMSAAKGTTLKAQKRTQGGEIPLYWQLPEHTVTHYRIRYGARPDKLSATQEVSIAELAIVKDDIQGKMYRYLLTPTKELLARTTNDELYYRVQAFNNASASKPSPLTRGRLRRAVTPRP